MAPAIHGRLPIVKMWRGCKVSLPALIDFVKQHRHQMNGDHRSPVNEQLLRAGYGRGAFTLTELLVVLGTLGTLALVLLPALASTQSSGSKAFQCLNNMRQLGLAGCLYANDNHDRLVTNSDQYPAPGVSKSRNWICPFGTSLDWSSSHKNTNTLYLMVDSP